MDNSEPLVKALVLLEQLARLGNRPSSTSDLVRLTGIPKSTLVRMLNTMEEQGYLLKDEGRYTSEFVFYKTLPLAGEERTRIRAICHDLHARTGKQIELIGVSGHDLYWHDTVSDPDAPVRVAAGPGFRRTLYELDAPSRLHLAAMFGGNADTIGERLRSVGFDPDGFYRTGLDYRKAKVRETAAIIAGTAVDVCEYDLDGNSNGIRRFAALIRCRGRFLAVLALAEAATPRSELNRHVEEVSNLLIEARSDIERFLEGTQASGIHSVISKETCQ